MSRRTSKHLEFLLELAHELRVGVLIDDGLVLDLLGLVGVTQRTECLLVLDVGGRYSSNHRSLGVSSQTVLQQPRQDLDKGPVRLSLQVRVNQTYGISVRNEILRLPLLPLLPL